MSEEEMRREWDYLSGVPRIEGVPVSGEDNERELRLLDAIRGYVRDEDFWSNLDER
jgi:hypothetical protein